MGISFEGMRSGAKSWADFDINFKEMRLGTASELFGRIGADMITQPAPKESQTQVK